MSQSGGELGGGELAMGRNRQTPKATNLHVPYLSSDLVITYRSSSFFLQFVPKTHYFFSVSKDKTVKYWDADKFEHIMTLQVQLCFMVS